MQVISKSIILCAASILGGSAGSQTPGGCEPIANAGFVITHPGTYCVTKDLNTRIGLPHRSAENPVIDIRVGNVTVDLQGHRIGRGRWIVQHGGNGIMISTSQLDGSRGAAPRIRNVKMRNGMLADLGVGIMYYASAYERPTSSRHFRKTGDQSYIYDGANIVMENVKFERCGEDMRFDDWINQ
jgi:hypothetical protein